MIIKLMPGNPCQSALVSFSKNDFTQIGIRQNELTLKNSKTRRLLGVFFELLREYTGLRRDGKYVSVMCRPSKNGGCRFYIQFTDTPSGRLFSFETADDLLDTLNQLRGRGQCDLSQWKIYRSSGNYKIYIPDKERLSPAALAILNEYSI